MSASEPLRSDRAQAQSAGRIVLGVCGVIALIALVIVAMRLMSGGGIAPLSVLMPAISLAGVAWLGLKMLRSATPVDVIPQPDERPSRRLPRYDTAAGTRSERPSDSGRHINA